MSREKQRQNKRAVEVSPSCTAGFELNKFEAPPLRPLLACDPTPPGPTADAFVRPDPCPPATPPPNLLPPGLLVGNDVQLAYCPTALGYSTTGTIAYSVTASEHTQQILFQSLSGINNNQLNYLYDVVPSASGDIISYSLSGATASVANITKLTDAQVSELMLKVQASKSFVDALSLDIARNSLLCQSPNDAIDISCPTGAYTGPTGPSGPPASLAYVPTASVATGTINVDFEYADGVAGLTAAQAQANALALALAQKTLRCVYPNDEITVSCCSPTAGGSCASGLAYNLGYLNAVPVDTLPVLPSLLPRVGEYTIAYASIFTPGTGASSGIASANEIALGIAYDNLNCYFPNDDQAEYCNEDSLGNYASPYPVLLSTSSYGVSGNQLTVTSSILSNNNLELNSRVFFTGSAPSGLSADTPYFIHSATAAGGSATIKLSSSIRTHEDYENGTNGPITISNTGGTLNICQDTTPGKYTYILRGKVLHIDLDSSISTATADALSLIQSSTDCYWGNISSSTSCPTASFTGINNLPYSLTASPALSDTFTAVIADNSYISYISQADANAIAASAASASLSCVYCNQAVNQSCTGAANQTTGVSGAFICDTNPEQAQNTAISIANIPVKESAGIVECCYYSVGTTATGCSPGYNAQSVPTVFLPAGTVTLCGSSASQAAANAAASSMAQSMIQCYYSNEAQTSTYCPPGMFRLPGSTGYVAPGTIISVLDLSNANSVALALATSLVICADFDWEVASGCTTVGQSPAVVTMKHNTTLTLTTTPNEKCEVVVNLEAGAAPSAVNIAKWSTQSVTLRKITICKNDGTNMDIIVPDMSAYGSDGSTISMAKSDGTVDVVGY